MIKIGNCQSPILARLLPKEKFEEQVAEAGTRMPSALQSGATTEEEKVKRGKYVQEVKTTRSHGCTQR
jgi:hypothetical protein